MKTEFAFRNQGVFLGLLIILFIAFIVNVFLKVSFFKLGNLFNVARSFSILGVVSIGQAFTIISGGLDLSVGSVISTSDVLVAALIYGVGSRVIPVCVLAIVMGAGVGLFNGLIITKRNVPPFIATLGTSIILKGIRLIFTKGSPKGNIPDSLRYIGIGSLGGVPVILFVFIGFVILYYLILERSYYGRQLYSTGSNYYAARLCGIKTDRVITLSYVFCSIGAALAGIMLAAYTGTADNWVGEGYELDSIAAAVVGGAVIGGGIGSVFGTIAGVLIIIILVNLSLLANLPIQSQMLVKGVVLIAAVWINSKRVRFIR